MNKNMIINFISNITFTTTKTTSKKNDTEITTYESKIQLPAPTPTPAPKPVLTKPVGFELIYEKNPNIKIADVKPHDDPHCCYIVYKEFSDNGNLLTGHIDKNGNVVEYTTMTFDWFETMRAANPVFVGNAAEMYVCRFLAAVISAFRKNPKDFSESIVIYNRQMKDFNKQISVINDMKSQIEEEKEKAEKAENLLNLIQKILTKNDPEKYSGLIADIRGSLGVPIEERYIKAAKHRRLTHKIDNK